MQFPIQNAAPSLRGKLQAELPHGFIPIPPEVRQLVEEERATMLPQAFNGPRGQLWMLNYWTLDFYFDDLGYEVIYRETPDGPVVVAVGSDETIPLMRKQAACGDPDNLKFYNG